MNIKNPPHLAYVATLPCETLMSARLANTLPKDEESAQDNHVLACNFAKDLPILIFLAQTQQ